jgi:hypothetical protein
MGIDGATTFDLTPNTFPSITQPNSYIGLWHDDLYPPGGQRIKTQLLGDAPNRRFVVWYDRVNPCCSGSVMEANTVDTQLVLFEGSGDFEIRQRSGVEGTHGIGFENATGMDGYTFYLGSANDQEGTTFKARRGCF